MLQQKKKQNKWIFFGKINGLSIRDNLEVVFMSNEFRKCNFCSYYDEYEGCEWGCNNHEDFKPDNDRIITKAKEKGISVADVIALININ